MSTGSRLPALGPRGEGWVVGQLVLMALVGVLGARRRGRLPLELGVRRLMTVIGVGALAGGVIVAVRGSVALGSDLTAMPHPREDARLVRTGIYRRIRHPIYAGVMLAGFGWAVAMASVPSVVTAVLLAAWLNAKARREEAWLGARFPDYAAYRATTPRFVPRMG